MKSRLILVLALFCSLFALTPLLAQPSGDLELEEAAQAPTGSEKQQVPEASAEIEPVVVTATRVETPLSQVTKSVSVVTREDRDAQQDYFIPELLDSEPGVYLRQLGGTGQWSHLNIRGVPSQYIQFQYNGFPVKDEADPQGAFTYFLGDLYSPSNMQRVEILKGTQSTLYGSQAMGGVIDLISDKWKRGIGAEVRSEFGEYGTFTENGRFFVGKDSFYIDFDPIYVRSDGPKYGGKHRFWYENFGFSGGAGFRITPDITLEFTSLFNDSDLAMAKTTPKLDSRGNLVTQTADPDQHREGLSALYGLTMNHAVSPCWSYSVKSSYAETQRHYFWTPTVDGNQSNYDGSTGYLETQHNFRVTDWLTLIGGLDFKQAYYDGQEPNNPSKEDYSPVYYKEHWYNWDLFTQASLKLLDESLFLNFGGRFNYPEAFDSKLVGEASAAYLFKQLGTKVHAHVGSGYRTPSLYEIYGGYVWNGTVYTIGNPDLTPEESVGYEVGIDQTLLDKKITVGLTWFRTDFKDLIQYDGFAMKYVNADRARTQGIETYVDITPWRWLKLNFAYTYVDSKVENDEDWTRSTYMPRNKISGLLALKLPHDLTTSVRVAWQDEKIIPLYGPNYSRVNWEEPSAVTVDTALTYTFLKNYSAFLRVQNLLDEDYTESGYAMTGRTFSGGVKLAF